MDTGLGGLTGKQACQPGVAETLPLGEAVGLELAAGDDGTAVREAEGEPAAAGGAGPLVQPAVAKTATATTAKTTGDLRNMEDSFRCRVPIDTKRRVADFAIIVYQKTAWGGGF
ncbi:MAG TPA: hypothetical protein VLF67_03495 [Candidatus Saccharimonas sp.]|nr:hypothetical protein [Candidatus Saccharimonas sp.]